MGNEFSIGAVGSGRQWWVLSWEATTRWVFLCLVQRKECSDGPCATWDFILFIYNVDAHAATGAHYQKPKWEQYGLAQFKPEVQAFRDYRVLLSFEPRFHFYRNNPMRYAQARIIACLVWTTFLYLTQFEITRKIQDGFGPL